MTIALPCCSVCVRVRVCNGCGMMKFFFCFFFARLSKRSKISIQNPGELAKSNNVIKFGEKH